MKFRKKLHLSLKKLQRFELNMRKQSVVWLTWLIWGSLIHLHRREFSSRFVAAWNGKSKPVLLQWMWPNPQETTYLVTFTEEILNAKLHLLCSANGRKKVAKHSLDRKQNIQYKGISCHGAFQSLRKMTHLNFVNPFSPVSHFYTLCVFPSGLWERISFNWYSHISLIFTWYFDGTYNYPPSNRFESVFHLFLFRRELEVVLVWIVWKKIRIFVQISWILKLWFEDWPLYRIFINKLTFC